MKREDSLGGLWVRDLLTRRHSERGGLRAGE